MCGAVANDSGEVVEGERSEGEALVRGFSLFRHIKRRRIVNI
jgi:hypothetical protein